MKMTLLGTAPKLIPRASFLSSVALSADRCIDNITDGSATKDLCQTKPEPAPWLAINFGVQKMTSIEKVVLFNRDDCCGSRTRNVEIRLSNVMPKSARQMFTGGELLGTFEGPARVGQKIDIHSRPGWEKKKGRYLIIQMDNGNEPLNLKEVFAYGITHLHTHGAITFHLSRFLPFPCSWS